MKKVNRPSSQILVVTRHRWSRIGRLGLGIGGSAVWYYFVLGLAGLPAGMHPFDYIRAGLSEHPVIWILVVVPALSLPRVLKDLRIIVLGEEFTFDGASRAVFKNQKWVASFDGIAHLQIRTTEGEYSTEHTLTAVLHTGEKIEIDDSKGDASDIVALADDIADILGLKVVRKFDPFNSLGMPGSRKIVADPGKPIRSA